MSKSKSNHKQKIPQWQIERMRDIIADRWLETWEVVADRDIERRTLSRFYNQCGKRDGFVEDL